jgi:hypothetical protein
MKAGPRTPLLKDGDECVSLNWVAGVDALREIAQGWHGLFWAFGLERDTNQRTGLCLLPPRSVYYSPQYEY